MKGIWAFLVLGICLTGCSLIPHHEDKPQAEKPPPEPRLNNTVETVTGKVVLVTEGYRLRIGDKDLVRLTRAHRASEFQNEEINLRKYYEKTLAVRGRREGEWIWAADIVGQWLRPGESPGPNVLAPPVGEEGR